MYDITWLLNKNNVFEDYTVPRLVSYPRTGSHWLRMMLEMSLGAPSYVQSFFDKNPSSCWGFHIHNRVVENPHWTEGPVTNLKNVLYLYRDPVDTIYSMLKYEKKIDSDWDGKTDYDLDSSVEQLITEYKAHLNRWMINNSDIENFMPLTYEELKNETKDSIIKVASFLNADVSHDRVSESIAKCDKSLTKKLTPHDPQALSSEYFSGKSNYVDNRSKFKTVYGPQIDDKFSRVLSEITG